MSMRWRAIHRRKLRLVRSLDVYGVRLTLRSAGVGAALLVIAVGAVMGGASISAALQIPMIGMTAYILLFDTPMRGRTLWVTAQRAVRFLLRPRRIRRPWR